MPWPVPVPGDVFNRVAAVFETDLPRVYALKNPNAPPAQVDARSSVSQLAVYGRTVDMATQDEWGYQGYLAKQLMVDQATDWLPRHAAIWSVPQILAKPAVGNAVFASQSGVTVPSGLALSVPGGLTYATTAAVTIAANSSAPVPVACDTAGTVGDLPAGTVLNVVSPLGGLTTQQATVDSGAISGADTETIDAWRARIQAKIRDRGAGGSAADFQRWTQEAQPGAIVTAISPQTGFITIAFAMPDGQTWRVPTDAEIATVIAYVNDAQARKPLGAPVVYVIAATLQPVNFTLHLVPDTVAIRAAATSALTLQMLADATIGGTIAMSRMDAALENASGEFSHDRSAPGADVTAAATTLSVIGSVSFT